VQAVADYVKDIYFRRRDGIAVNLYAPSRVRWIQGTTTVAITQQSEYPIGQTVHFSIDCAAPADFTIGLRIPGWLEQNPHIKVNGAVISIDTRKGFACVRRTWHRGDSVELELPLNFRSEPIDDLHPKTMAIMRGPIMYVQLNPGVGEQSLPDLQALIAMSGTTGHFVARKERLFVPFHIVLDERYTTYFERA
jgi:DUF1680 family protein